MKPVLDGCSTCLALDRATISTLQYNCTADLSSATARSDSIRRARAFRREDIRKYEWLLTATILYVLNGSALPQGHDEEKSKNTPAMPAAGFQCRLSAGLVNTGTLSKYLTSPRNSDYYQKRGIIGRSGRSRERDGARTKKGLPPCRSHVLISDSARFMSCARL